MTFLLLLVGLLVIIIGIIAIVIIFGVSRARPSRKPNEPKSRDQDQNEVDGWNESGKRLKK